MAISWFLIAPDLPVKDLGGPGSLGQSTKVRDLGGLGRPKAHR